MLRVPRPEWPVSLELRGGSYDLVVAAVRGVEEAEAYESANEENEPEQKLGRLLEELTVMALRDSVGPVFRSTKQLRNLLTVDEVKHVGAVVYDALGIVSPSYARSDAKAWAEALLTGARANMQTAVRLAECCDVVLASEVVRLPRPERYFGLGVGELTDGHMMAAVAARKVLEEVESG